MASSTLATSFISYPAPNRVVLFPFYRPFNMPHKIQPLVTILNDFLLLSPNVERLPRVWGVIPVHTLQDSSATLTFFSSTNAWDISNNPNPDLLCPLIYFDNSCWALLSSDGSPVFNHPSRSYPHNTLRCPFSTTSNQSSTLWRTIQCAKLPMQPTVIETPARLPCRLLGLLFLLKPTVRMNPQSPICKSQTER